MHGNQRSARAAVGRTLRAITRILLLPSAAGAVFSAGAADANDPCSLVAGLRAGIPVYVSQASCVGDWKTVDKWFAENRPSGREASRDAGTAPGSAQRASPPKENAPAAQGAPQEPSPAAQATKDARAEAFARNVEDSKAREGTATTGPALTEEDKDTLKAQSKSTQVDALSMFSTSSSNGSSLVTAHIATAYAPALISFGEKDPAKRYKHWYNDVGVDISASLPAQSSTLPDYGRHALLKLDGGVINIYGSLAGRDPLDPTYAPLGTGNENPRVKSWDHIYFLKATTPDTMLPYIKHGLGMRGIKTALEGSGGFGGLGTYYFGLGLDGPLLSGLGPVAKDPHAGWFTIEGYGTANAINHRTLETIFGGTGAPGGFFAAGGRVKIGLPGKFFLSAEYTKAFGSYGRNHIGDASIVTFGYNNESEATATAPRAKKPDNGS